MSTRRRHDWSRYSRVVIDTSVLAAYFLGEPGVEDLEHVRHKLQLPFAAVCEMLYLVTRKKGRAHADQCFGLMKSWHVPILHSTEESTLAASRLKSQYALGLGDAFIAAISLCERVPLLTYDSDFLPLSEEIDLLGIK